MHRHVGRRGRTRRPASSARTPSRSAPALQRRCPPPPLPPAVCRRRPAASTPLSAAFCAAFRAAVAAAFCAAARCSMCAARRLLLTHAATTSTAQLRCSRCGMRPPHRRRRGLPLPRTARTAWLRPHYPLRRGALMARCAPPTGATRVRQREAGAAGTVGGSGRDGGRERGAPQRGRPAGRRSAARA